MRNKICALLILVLSFWSFDAWAQDRTEKQKGPMKITADKTLEWQRTKQQYVADGNVVILQDDMKLTADHVVADYRDAVGGAGKQADGSGVDIYRITATGTRVVIETSTETAVGTRAVYDRDQNIATLEGPVTITRGANVLNGAYATVDLTTKLSTLHGDPKSGGRVTGVFYTDKK
jgi:lipopolysaccharide transport protein LptA